MTDDERQRSIVREKLNQVWYEEKTCVSCGVVITGSQHDWCEFCLNEE